MEADWEVEIGPGAPVIEVDWPGRIDLRAHPALAFTLPESRDFPSLASTLQLLNHPACGLITSKCDVWDLENFDADEMDAPAHAVCARACYIDLAPAAAKSWPTHESAVAWCRERCASLRRIPLRSCRIDLIVRRAELPAADHPSATLPPESSYAVTAYLSACAGTLSKAGEILGSALNALIQALQENAAPIPSEQKLQ